MSFPLDDSVTRSLARQRVQEFIREAEIDHVLSERHPREASRWSHLTAAPLRRLGHALTRLGERLETLDLPNPELSREHERFVASAPNE